MVCTNGQSTCTAANSANIPVGVVPISGPSYVNKTNLVAAVDYDLASGDQIRGRYIYNKFSGIDTNAALPAFYTTYPDNRHTLSISEFHNFSPTFINELRVSYQRKSNITLLATLPFRALTSSRTSPSMN